MQPSVTESNYKKSEKRHKTRNSRQKQSFWRRRKWWLMTGGLLAAVIIATNLFLLNSRPVYSEAPEAQKVLAVQEGLNFGILIPTFMPKGFDRESVDIQVNESGPSGEKMAALTYRNLGKKAAVFIKQWVPGNPELEILNKSIPIETAWGKGWLMTQGGESGIGTLWVDIGQLRVSVSSTNRKLVPAEYLLQMANTLGLASEQQVYTFKTEPIVIRGVAPPPPFEVELNEQGIQELNLTITPGGYTPVRFLVKKDIPVKINFRAIGEVGCGNTGALTIGGGQSVGISVYKDKPLDIVEFTPKEVGEFPFYCTTNCYRGVMIVEE
jgi:hypothetical protein